LHGVDSIQKLVADLDEIEEGGKLGREIIDINSEQQKSAKSGMMIVLKQRIVKVNLR
jgi:hypothetical protein